MRREGVLRGGYIARREKGKLDLILLSCGSELQHALVAAKELGDGVRVVSMPCFERFERQSDEISRAMFCLTSVAGVLRLRPAFLIPGIAMSDSTEKLSACTVSA